MNKTLLSAVSFLACSMLSMVEAPHSELLNDEDYRLQSEAFAAHDSALSAPLDGKTPYWESYDQWLCFPADKVEVTCLEAEYGGIVPVPAIHVVQTGHYYEITMDPDPKPDCELVSRRWRELLDGESEFCAYAAPLQEHDAVPEDSGARDGSIWIVNRLKSSKGSWDFTTEENWLKDPVE
jgi:hypothetical protein